MKRAPDADKKTPEQEYNRESVPLADGSMTNPTRVELVARVLFLLLPELLG
jgi:hypothetical protein